MASIGIINEQGQEVERRVTSREGSFDTTATGEISPTIVQRIKFDNKGIMSSITTECGETENRRQSDQKPTITVEGIILEDEIDGLRAIQNDEEITFISDIYRGEVNVQRLSIVQKEDLLYFKPDGSNEKHLAFNFQIQLKKP